MSKVYIFAFPNRSAVWRGVVTANTVSDLFWTIDEFGDPFSALFKRIPYFAMEFTVEPCIEDLDPTAEEDDSWNSYDSLTVKGTNESFGEDLTDSLEGKGVWYRFKDYYKIVRAKEKPQYDYAALKKSLLETPTITTQENNED